MPLQSIINWLATFLGGLQQPNPAHHVSPDQALRYETQSLPETLARIAESQVGVKEQGGYNTGPKVQAYQAATWLPGTGWEWCAAFVDWCLLQALGVLALVPAGWHAPQTAGAWDLENWGNGKEPHGPNKAWVVLDPQYQLPRRGDIVTFVWSHTGIVTGYDSNSRRIETVEGNAPDGVYRKTHTRNQIRRIIRYVG